MHNTRPRLTRSSSSVSTPPAVSFSNHTYHIENGGDLHNARRASSSRVLDVWSSLAERYSRRLADDDIVDLRTGDIIKDRNVLRSTSVDYNIGCFGDPRAHADGTDTPTDEGADSEDELDSFAPGADISDELEMERVYREGVLPVTEMDPADAEDLKEFLEAENKRKELFGSDSEENYGGGDEDSPFTYEEAGKSFNGLGDGLSDEGEWFEADLDQEGVKDGLSQTGASSPLGDDSESGSEDELGGWDKQDEGSTVYAIADDLNFDDAGSVVELSSAPYLSPEPGAPAPSSSGTRSTTHSKLQVDSQSVLCSSSSDKKTLMTTVSRTGTKPQNTVRKAKWKTEVVIPYRSSSSSNHIHNKSSQKKHAHSHPDPEVVIDISDDEHAGPQATLPRLFKTSKGKKKADAHQANPPSSDGESDALVALSPDALKRRLASDSDRLSAPPPSIHTPSKGRKRKRALSSLSPEFEHHGDWMQKSNTEPSVISPEIDLTDQRHSTYAMGQISSSPKTKPYGKCTMRSNKAHEQTLGTCQLLIEGPNHHPHPNSADKEEQHSTYSVPPLHFTPQIQGSQAQFLLLQAIQHLSYLMSASGHTPNQPIMDQPTRPQMPMSGPSLLPFVQPPFNPPEPPYSTSVQHYYRSRPAFKASSPIASTSTSSSAYPTPSHQRSYTSSFSPSSATPPPSSSYETSSPNAATGRFPSLLGGRSKSRGRRVSFIINDDRSHGLPDPERSARFGYNDSASDDFEPLEYSSPSKRARETLRRSRDKSRIREPSPHHAGEWRSSSSDPKRRKDEKGKWQSVSIEEMSDTDKPRTRSGEDHRPQDRAQTPGPPSAPATRTRSRLRHNR